MERKRQSDVIAHLNDQIKDLSDQIFESKKVFFSHGFFQIIFLI